MPMFPTESVVPVFVWPVPKIVLPILSWPLAVADGSPMLFPMRMFCDPLVMLFTPVDDVAVPITMLLLPLVIP